MRRRRAGPAAPAPHSGRRGAVAAGLAVVLGPTAVGQRVAAAVAEAPGLGHDVLLEPVVPEALARLLAG